MNPASPPQLLPTDLLADLAAAMLDYVPTDKAEWRRQLEGIDVGFESPAEWALDADELAAFVINGFKRWPPPAPSSPKDFARYALQLQRLDRWHAPILPSSVSLGRLETHDEALDRLATDGRLNSNAAKGHVVPKESWDIPFTRAEAELNWAADPSPFAVVNSLLHVCAYLPAQVSGDDPDDEAVTDARLINVRFRRFGPGSIQVRRFESNLRIAIAPVLEAATDAKPWVDGNRYSIHPAIPFSRLEAIIRAAIEAEADLLLLPEMTVDADTLDKFRSEIPTQRQDYFARTGSLPRLSLVICGVVRKRTASEPVHRNFVAVLDGDGTSLFEQEKLSHWNLGEGAQKRFGLFGSYPVPLIEDTVPGTALEIAELPGFGRMVTLICADMSANMPGDWITANVGLDWIYAPIMDGSACWHQGGAPWIIRRAKRAAEDEEFLGEAQEHLHPLGSVLREV